MLGMQDQESQLKGKENEVYVTQHPQMHYPLEGESYFHNGGIPYLTFQLPLHTTWVTPYVGDDKVGKMYVDCLYIVNHFV